MKKLFPALNDGRRAIGEKVGMGVYRALLDARKVPTGITRQAWDSP